MDVCGCTLSPLSITIIIIIVITIALSTKTSGLKNPKSLLTQLANVAHHHLFLLSLSSSKKAMQMEPKAA